MVVDRAHRRQATCSSSPPLDSGLSLSCALAPGGSKVLNQVRHSETGEYEDKWKVAGRRCETSVSTLEPQSKETVKMEEPAGVFHPGHDLR